MDIRSYTTNNDIVLAYETIYQFPFLTTTMSQEDMQRLKACSLVDQKPAIYAMLRDCQDDPIAGYLLMKLETVVYALSHKREMSLAHLKQHYPQYYEHFKVVTNCYRFPVAMFQLAKMLDATLQSRDAQVWMIHAAKHYAPAQYEMGMYCLYHNIENRGIEFLSQAASQQHRLAMIELGNIYLFNQYNFVKSNHNNIDIAMQIFSKVQDLTIYDFAFPAINARISPESLCQILSYVIILYKKQLQDKE